MHKLTVVVTGYTGKQGGAVARGLLEGGHKWFDRVGHDVDVVGLRWLYPEVDWHRFSTWARDQDWSVIPATTPHRTRRAR